MECGGSEAVAKLASWDACAHELVIQSWRPDSPGRSGDAALCAASSAKREAWNLGRAEAPALRPQRIVQQPLLADPYGREPPRCAPTRAIRGYPRESGAGRTVLSGFFVPCLLLGRPSRATLWRRLSFNNRWHRRTLGAQPSRLLPDIRPTIAFGDAQPVKGSAGTVPYERGVAGSAVHKWGLSPTTPSSPPGRVHARR